MSKKDYVLIARVFNGVLEDNLTSSQVAMVLADVLASTNPRFDRGRFLTACGVEN